MKRAIIFIVLGLGILIGLFIYIVDYGHEAKREAINAVNIKGLKPGMSLDNALEIMGKPYEVREYPNENDPGYRKATRYFYERPGNSDWFMFEVDSMNTVVIVEF